MRKIKIAVLSVSAGAGHVRAAQAIERVANERYENVEATHFDVMDYVPKMFRKLYAESYVHIVNRYPALWGYMYAKSDVVRGDKSMVKKLRVAVERLNTKKLLKKMVEFSPDILVSTHFLPPELISRMIKAGIELPPSWVQVTDFDLHSLWVQDHMTGYFAASEEIAFRMAAKGIPSDTIHATGIPIMPEFAEKPERSECARELGMDPEKTTLLLMSGGLGVGDIASLAERLVAMDADFQIVALAGKNAKLLDELKKLAVKHPEKLFPLGFTTTIERVMAASDLAVTKPGGLTSSECLAMGLPMIVVSPIPGQEERNADYLMENGAALKAQDALGVEFKVATLLEDPERLTEMGRAAKAISNPFAAEKVLDIILDSLDVVPRE
jgi:processive 1,2-diacylglycerol beta-glucosyltransferase